MKKAFSCQLKSGKTFYYYLFLFLNKMYSFPPRHLMVYRDEKSWASLKRFSFLFCFVPSVSGMNSVLSTSPKCLFRMQEVRKEPITQMPTFTLN